MNRTVRVVRRGRAWKVVADRSERLEDLYCTKERALEHALDLARGLDPHGAVTVSVDDLGRLSIERYVP